MPEAGILKGRAGVADKRSVEVGKRLKAGALRVWGDIWEYRMFILAFVIYDALAQLCFHAFCPVVIVTGMPCPGCGMTRAVFYFATGQWERGWEMNPLGILWLALAVYFVVMRYWMGKRAKGVLQIGGCLVVCMLLLYGYRMYRYFPGEPPIAYSSGNLLSYVTPGYEERMMEIWNFIKGVRP